MKKIILFSVVLFTAIATTAQDFSNKGKDFWVGYGYHERMLQPIPTGGSQDMILYFATDSATTVTISCASTGYSATYNIPANTVFATSVIPKAAPQDHRLFTEGLSNKGLHIVSTKPVVAYAHIYNSSVSGATILYPTNTLGKEYYSVNYKNISNSNDANCWFYVVAVDTGTTVVEITPSDSTVGGWLPNNTYTVNLTQGQIYNVMGKFNNSANPKVGVDLTGSKIKSIASGTGGCKRIAVFSGSGRISLTCNGTSSSSDNYMAQALPKSAWGKNYLTVPSAGYGNAATNPTVNRTPNIYRICVLDPSTQVNVDGVINGYPLQNNFYYEVPSSTTPHSITADKPIMVSQYFPSSGACSSSASGDGDPEVIYLSPTEQSINKVRWNACRNNAINSAKHYINIVIKNSGTAISSFKLDGATVAASNFFTHPNNSAYSYAILNVSGSNTPPGIPHVVESDSGFNAIAYGYGGAESYGYNAGTNIKDLFTFITPINPLSISTEVTACTGTPFYFSVTLPKHPDSLTYLIWDYHGFFGTHNDTINAPLTADSTYMIGTQQVWRYKLNHTHTYSPAGIYPVTITAGTINSEGCGNSVIIDRDLYVYDPPILGFKGINNGCVTDSVAFTDTTTYAGTTYSYKWWWDFGDGNFGNTKNPKHLYSSPGTYTVRYATVTNVGCLSDTASRQITVTLVPSAKFGMSSPICAGVPITFSDSSVAYAPGTLTRWIWNFSNGTGRFTRDNGSDTAVTYNSWNPSITDTLWVETNSGCRSPFFTKTFKVNPIPFVDFTLPAGICLPADSAHFFDASTLADGLQAGFTYLWNFDDPPSGANNTSTLKNPVHYYATPPSPAYNINLQVTSAAGCVHDTTKALSNVYAQAHADFTVGAENCLNDVTNFTDNSNGSGNTVTQWFWDFGEPASGAANTSNLQNPSHTYLTAGTFTIKHWVRTNVNCTSDTMTKTVIINPLPTASFTSTGPFCQAGTINFTDASVANAGTLATWAWNFGDPASGANNTSALQNPTHTYATAGTYTVTLTVTSTKGCVSAVYTSTVVIHPLPVPGFTHAQACLPYQPVSFTNTSAVADGTALSYAWDFGDPASGIANTSNVTNPTHLYSGTGPFVVTLTVTSAPGCINTTTQNITDVYAQAHADFMVGAENCLNDVTTFTSNATGSGNPIANYRWDFGEPASGAANLSSLQNPTHTYLTPGTYSIKHWVITDKGCTSDTTTKTVVINPLPTANFNYNSPSCETRDITFTDLSLANVGTLTNWAWNFNDPASGAANTSSLQNPIHTFASSGTYNVTLTVTNTKGCVSAVLTKPVTINARPQAGFIIPEVCLSDTYAQFTDTSKIAAGTITAWAWNFGDPVSGAANTSNLQNPQHSYTAVGNYSVQLIVTSNNGCKDTIVQTLTVNGSFPVANFTVNNPTTLCANDSVAIVNTSTVFPGTITKVEIYWDNVNFPATFELDDFPYAGKVYKHLYPNFQSPLSKIFTIRFRAYSGGICVNDKVSTITVNAAPKVQFNNIPNICLDAAPYQITQASEVGGVPGNGVYSGPGVSPGGLFNPATAGPGTFTIKYTYTSTVGGCVDTLSKTITVYEPPVADFSFSTSLCETKPITFTDNSNTPVGLLTTWTWDFGDGTPVVVRNTPAPFTHTFANWGAYNVSLRVATSNGCVSIAKILPVDVRPQPKPNFTFPASVCLPNAVIPFTNTSTIADASALTYLWNFGDPGSGTANSSTAVSPSHTYVAVGPFNINLQATSAAGCVHDTTIALNVIHPQPKADFSINKPSVCIGQDVSFRDLSDGKDGTVNQWFWNFGDAGTSNIQNPTHLYGAVNNYVISLYIINSQGCNSDTVSKTFDVYPYPVVNAGPDKVVLEGGTVVLTASATGNDLLYLWTPATYLNDRRILQPAASNLLDDITYTLTVTARGGCAASDKVFVKLLRAPRIPNTFTPNNDGINDTWVIEYLDTYPGNRVQIFTRTGQLVFESRGYSKPWDGTMNGKPLPFDTYYYIIEPNNGRKAMTGYVTIVK